MPAKNNFSRNLATAIEARKLQKSFVAKSAETSRSYVDMVLDGKVDPSLSRGEALAKAVGFPLIALLDSPENFSESVLTDVLDLVHS